MRLEEGYESLNPPENYVELDVIGNGAYATVYRGCQRTDSNNTTYVALKKIKVTLTNEGLPLSLIREISTLRHLEKFSHPNIIRLLDVCHGRRLEKELIMFLVFEHVEQDLSTFMRSFPGGLPSDKIKNLTHQMLLGIDFLHSHRILHRDLKPQNILITNDGRVKLADFGLAKTYEFEMRLTSVVVTLWYRSPELLLGRNYGTPVDIWSIGCIMAEMFTLAPLFAGISEGDQLDKIFRVIGTPLEREWPQDVAIPLNSFTRHLPQDIKRVVPGICRKGSNLLESLLEFSPDRRIDTYGALNHEYFDESTYVIPPQRDESSNIPTSSPPPSL